MQMADVKPSVLSWVLVGLMAITFIVAIKVIDNRWPIPGLHQLLGIV
jgi:hypothetical protein